MTYGIVTLISFLIRTFILPNPFEPLGDMAVILNWLFSGVLIPISYVFTGFFYSKGDCPALGSFLFLVFYVLNTGIIYLICMAYPLIWLMILIGMAYLALIVGINCLLEL